ncbi:hypothetical protein HY045_03375 [Candidatus Woesebacteria bacterium]|nr:hypothetical protein [Candidatus Woesebacteria bacterium]
MRTEGKKENNSTVEESRNLTAIGLIGSEVAVKFRYNTSVKRVVYEDLFIQLKGVGPDQVVVGFSMPREMIRSLSSCLNPRENTAAISHTLDFPGHYRLLIHQLKLGICHIDGWRIGSPTRATVYLREAQAGSLSVGLNNISIGRETSGFGFKRST